MGGLPPRGATGRCCPASRWVSRGREARMSRRTIALLSAALLSLAACVDLNEDLISGLANQPYPTPDVFQALVNASYEPLRSFYAQERGFTLTDFGTDIYTEGADGSYKYINEYTAQLNPDVDFIRDTWSDFYRAINTANTAIAQAPTVQMDSSLKTQRGAEVLSPGALLLRPGADVRAAHAQVRADDGPEHRVDARAGGQRVRRDHHRPEVRRSESPRRGQGLRPRHQRRGAAPVGQGLPDPAARRRFRRRRSGETAGRRLRQRRRLRPASHQLGPVCAAAAVQRRVRLQQREERGGHLVGPVHQRPADHRERQQGTPVLPDGIRRAARHAARHRQRPPVQALPADHLLFEPVRSHQGLALRESVHARVVRQ